LSSKKLIFARLSGKTLLHVVLAGALGLGATVAATRISTAGFTAEDVRTHVEIDGIDYGTFDRVDGLKEVGSGSGDAGDASFHKITLKRDFVTDPSLYLWAKNIMHGRSDLKDVHIVMEDRDGEEISRYVLRFCQPLSWSVEAANPALGGFHEKIDLAVQEISVY
jgi:hypothetical protein